jgi:hypothetical protein
MVVFLRSVENDFFVLGRLHDPLRFGHRGAPVCCYRISSYLISSKYHQTVVNINPCQANTLVIGEIRRFSSPVLRSYNSVIVCAEIRSFMDKQSSSTAFVLLCISSYTIIFLCLRFGDITGGP